jgi:iron complex outermembrane receptor protein
LNSIPISAIERVEILTDGASSIYGSDAIAGVVNFIMKSNLTDTTVSVRADRPQEDGGESWNFSVSTGFGEIEADGYNILLAFSHDDQSKLRSVDREFSNTGIIPFSYQGNDLVFQRTSVNAIPANAYLTFDWNGDGVYDALDTVDGGPSATRSFNPYNEANGSCAPNNGLSGTTCAYDFTETLEIISLSVRFMTLTKI